MLRLFGAKVAEFHLLSLAVWPTEQSNGLTRVPTCFAICDFFWWRLLEWSYMYSSQLRAALRLQLLAFHLPAFLPS